MYINSFEIFNSYPDNDLVAIRAECGVGKTYSLAKELKAHGLSSLYICHRVALRDANAKNFTDSTCINSLPFHSKGVNFYDFLIWDEFIASKSSLLWYEVDLNAILLTLSSFRGKVIVIDRDVVDEDIFLLNDIFKRSSSKFHFASSKIELENKSVPIMNELDTLFATLKETRGLKLVCSDHATNILALAEKWRSDLEALGDFVITITGKDDFMPIETAIALAEEKQSATVFVSPKIGEGFSLDSPQWVLNAYIFYGCRGVFLPANKVYQACHRVRNREAKQMVVLMPHQKHFELNSGFFWNVIDDDSNLKGLFLGHIGSNNVSLAIEQYGSLDIFLRETPAFQIFEELCLQSAFQMSNIYSAISHQFTLGGYEVLKDFNSKGKLNAKIVQAKPFNIDFSQNLQRLNENNPLNTHEELFFKIFEELNISEKRSFRANHLRVSRNYYNFCQSFLQNPVFYDPDLTEFDFPTSVQPFLKYAKSYFNLQFERFGNSKDYSYKIIT